MKKRNAGDTAKPRKASSLRNATMNDKMLFIMSCIIPTSVASADDLRSIDVVPGKQVRTSKGVVTLSPDQQQTLSARTLVAKNKRSVTKYITALFTTTSGATPTALLGDAFAATGLSDTSGAWQFQNNASAGPNNKQAFNNMVIGQPFKYFGIQIDVSSYALFSQLAWREYITDYDSTNNYDWSPKVNAGLNTFAQLNTTRFLKVGGEFNGNWSIYMTGFTTTTAGQTVKFTFNCVDIQRSW